MFVPVDGLDSRSGVEWDEVGVDAASETVVDVAGKISVRGPAAPP